MKCFRSPRSKWITGMDVALGVASSWKIFASAVQDPSSSAAMYLEVWGIGFGLHPAHKTCYFNGSLKYFDLCFGSAFLSTVSEQMWTDHCQWSLRTDCHLKYRINCSETTVDTVSQFQNTSIEHFLIRDVWLFHLLATYGAFLVKSLQLLPNVSLCMLEVKWTWCSVLCEAVR